MADINTLKKRRAHIKGNMTKLINFINAISDTTNVEDIKARLANVERYRTEFNETEDKIVSLKNEEELDPEFEDNYYKVVAGLNLALRKKGERTMSLNDSQLDASAAAMHLDVRLPKLSIPLFTGNYTDWQSFHDLFCSTIHDNPRLTPAQKLQYLKGTLRGEAASLLRHFSTTDANYHEALQKLRDRFDRKKHIITSFIKNFMFQPSVTTANSANVRHILDTSDEILRGLKALGPEAETRDHWLIYILVSKLDSETTSQWAQISATYDMPTVEQFFDFLTKRIDALDSIKGAGKRSHPYCSQSKPTVRSHVVSPKLNDSEIPECSLCPKENHRLFECNKFKEMQIDDRKILLKTQNRCFNCLNDNHHVSSCRSKFRCRQCNRKHHTLVHEHIPEQSISTSCAVSSVQTNEDHPPIVDHQTYTTTTNRIASALLPTALVKVADKNNQLQFCRVLLDSGSQGSFITERFAQKLQLRRSSAKLAISGIGATTNGYTRGAVSLVITPWNKTEPKVQLEAFVFPKLTAKLPSIAEYINKEDYKQYELADPYFYTGHEIDIIMGADNFFEILSEGKITTENQLILQNTKLGWIIAGKATEVSLKQSITITINESEDNLDNLLRRFWEIENTTTTEPPLSHEEKLCEAHFTETKTVDNYGRIKVGLPFKISPAVLGDSYPKAVQRMFSIERRFLKNPEFAKLYKDFMREYLTLGHMKEIENNRERNDEPQYYLPHHGVIKSTSSTTKLRVVFDGSSKTTTGKSLNDCLAVGPTVQSSLYDILSRFRKFKVAITADIEKMYRQVLIADGDTKFQKIIWREDSTKSFATYALQTVTYGTASASYLATRAVNEAADKFINNSPQAVSKIKSDMYVDDLMTGANTLEEAINLKDQIQSILSNSGFRLRKWLSNERALNDSVELKDKSKIFKSEESSNDTTKVLGLHWDPVSDCFKFKVHLNELPTTTKRGILSEASRIFDPLGWLAPFTITIKIFFQSLWVENLTWDDQLSPNLLNDWLKLRSNLYNTEKIQVPRYLHTKSESKIVLHGFSDASKQAYSAVVYGKITNQNGESFVKLLSAKTKVAPVKQLSIPRLELCGALLVSKLLLSVKRALKAEITEIVAWTDSTIVLDWLNAHPSKWNTFVGNRTGDILTNFNRSQWRHIDSQDNPADCASRGLDPDKLQHFKLWWNGPEWLMNEKDWPKT